MADGSPRVDGQLNGVGRCLGRICQWVEGERFGGFGGWLGNVERERNAELFVSLQIEMDRIQNIDYLIGGLLREEQRKMALPSVRLGRQPTNGCAVRTESWRGSWRTRALWNWRRWKR